MARYKCPACGMDYDGKKCRHCYYETFSEEIAHGSHTHRGEPLVIRSRSRRSIPKKDPFGCEKKTKKKNTSLPSLILAILIFFAEPAVELAADLIRSLEDTVSAFTQAEPERTLPEDTMILYQGGELCIRTEWKYGDSFGDGFSIWLENFSDRDITVTAREITVNGYFLEEAYLFCRAGEDGLGWGGLRIEEEELRHAGITDIHQIAFFLELYDSDTYETISITPIYQLSADPDYVPVPNDLGGMVILEQDDLRVSYLGYAPDPDRADVFAHGKFLFHMENSSDHYRQVVLSEADPDFSFWVEIPPHTNFVADCYLYGLVEQGIESLEQVPQLTFRLEYWNRDQEHEAVVTNPISVSTVQ